MVSRRRNLDLQQSGVSVVIVSGRKGKSHLISKHLSEGHPGHAPVLLFDRSSKMLKMETQAVM